MSFVYSCNKTLLGQPIGYLPNEKILIVENICGKTLLRSILEECNILNLATNISKLEKAFISTASWLNNFQNSFPVEKAKLNESFAYKIENNLNMAPISKTAKKRSLDIITTMDQKINVTLCHGDLSSRNILLDNNERIKVVDWLKLEKNYFYHDLCNFFVATRFLARYWFIKKSTLDKLNLLFIDNYKKGTCFEFSDELIKVMKIIKTQEYYDKKKIKTHIFRKHYKNIMHELSKDLVRC